MSRPPQPEDFTLTDGFNRRINYLRLSVTDRCNLRCTYCLPATGLPLYRRDDLLSDDHLLTVARVAVGLGIRKIRVTGGEPLLREGVVELLAALRALPGLERLVLTTNGTRLADLAGPLSAAGVDGLNISIDSLDPDRFRAITRGGDLSRVLAGIEAALADGFRTKLNVVVMQGVNDDEILDFVDLTRTRPLSVRFIEYMPTQGGAADRSLTLPSDTLLARIRGAFGELDDLDRKETRHSGPARRYRLPGAAGTIGVISALSCRFCSDCNRIRVTASGTAKGCLFHESSLDLKPWLASGDEAGLADALRRIVADKPEAHPLSLPGHTEGPGKPDDPDDDLRVPMSRLGG